MYVVIFEVKMSEDKYHEYISLAQKLLPLAHKTGGLISVERFKSISSTDSILSLSFWKDERSIQVWRENTEHKVAQATGRHSIFTDYRISVAKVVRHYDMKKQAPSSGE